MEIFHCPLQSRPASSEYPSRNFIVGAHALKLHNSLVILSEGPKDLGHLGQRQNLVLERVNFTLFDLLLNIIEEPLGVLRMNGGRFVRLRFEDME